jgi:predicted transcriptional regulator
MMRYTDLKQGDLENLILNALWKLEADGIEHVFVSDVLDAIRSPEREWAYTTVKTVMDRLVEKQLASRNKLGKRFFYASVLNRELAGREAVKKITRQYFLNDIDELQACISALRNEGFAIQAASDVSREKLERAFNTPAISATL